MPRNQTVATAMLNSLTPPGSPCALLPSPPLFTRPSRPGAGLELIERREVRQIRLQHDLDAAILRTMLGRVVGGNGIEFAVAGRCQHRGLHAVRDQEPGDLDGARGR